jgi:hypothetical protein
MFRFESLGWTGAFAGAAGLGFPAGMPAWADF